MIESWRNSLLDTYDDAFDALESVVRDCPDDLWEASVWTVRITDRHVWPITRGVGADLPDNQRLQIHSAFWNVAYHVLFFCDYYLGGGIGQPAPPPPFRGDEQQNHTLPHRVYTRDEVLGLLDHCRVKARSVFHSLTDEAADRRARIGHPFADLLIRNLVQVYDHTSQLALFLNYRADWSDPRWTPADRWYRPCPDCADSETNSHLIH